MHAAEKAYFVVLALVLLLVALTAAALLHVRKDGTCEVQSAVLSPGHHGADGYVEGEKYSCSKCGPEVICSWEME